MNDDFAKEMTELGQLFKDWSGEVLALYSNSLELAESLLNEKHTCPKCGHKFKRRDEKNEKDD